mgnify:CR=1 FL=1
MLRLSNLESKRLFKVNYPEWDKTDNGNLLVLSLRNKYDKKKGSPLETWCEKMLSSNYIIKNNIILKSLDDYIVCKMMTEFFFEPLVSQPASLK